MMAETPSKRQREETLIGEEADPKRHHNHKYSYNHILSLLEEDEETLEVEPLPSTQLDFSSILNTLQRELHDDHPSPTTGSGSGSGSGSHSDTGDIRASDPSPEPDVETERFMTMRHLLQASDDELGIPNRSDNSGDGEVINGGDAFSVGGDGLWDLEFEDQSANYYTLLQSQFFM